MSDKIEQMIDEIHDMLIEYMHESDASPILNKVRKLAEDAHQDGITLEEKRKWQMLLSMVTQINKLNKI